MSYVYTKKRTAIKIKISEPNLKRPDEESSYFDVNTKKYEQALNQTQRIFVEGIVGEKENLLLNTGMFKKNDYTLLKIYKLSEGYIKENVKEGYGIIRACFLNLGYLIFKAEEKDLSSKMRLCRIRINDSKKNFIDKIKKSFR